MEILNGKALSSVIQSRGVSQGSLARDAGISRAHIARLLTGPPRRVRRSTLLKLAHSLGVEASHLVEGGRMGAYRDLIVAHHGRIDFGGLGLSKTAPQYIEDLYVDVAVREEGRPTDDGKVECVPNKVGLGRLDGETSAASKAIDGHDRIVLIGDPGVGKTMALRYAAYSHASHTGGKAKLPLHVRLSEFSKARETDESMDIATFVSLWAARGGCSDLASVFREELRNGRCLVLLDGLDEIGAEDAKAQMVKCVQAFVREYPRNRFALSSRVVGFDGSPWWELGFSVVRMLGYRDAEMKEFTKKWTHILCHRKKESAEELRSLWSAISSDRRIRSLSQSPLMLTILVLLYHARGGNFPRRRVDFYEKVIDVFLETWESSKFGPAPRDDSYYIDLDAREFRWLLSDVSLAMQRAELSLAQRWWLAERIQDYLQTRLGFERETAKNHCDGIVRYLSERTGLIVEQGPDLFGFSHRTLQEYFAALGLLYASESSPARDISSKLRGFLFHPMWSEVVRLVAAQLTPPQVESLISTMTDDPDPVGRFLRRGDLLALRCLCDGASLANRGVAEEIFKRVSEVGDSKWLGITFEVVDGLSEFRGTRWETYANEATSEILQRARSGLEIDEFRWLLSHVRAADRISQIESQSSFADQPVAAKEVSVRLDDQDFTTAVTNRALYSEHPEVWYESVGELLTAENQCVQFKRYLLYQLRRRVITDDRSRSMLRDLLASTEGSEELREDCAWSLSFAVDRGDAEATSLLLNRLRNDLSDKVKGACAAALAGAVEIQVEVKQALIAELESPSEAVRVGAIRGIEPIALQDAHLRGILLRLLRDAGESESIRATTIWALEDGLGNDNEISEVVTSLLENDRSGCARRVAAQALATAMSSERIPWNPYTVELVEHILTAIDDPCPHALNSLQGLATTREVRRGLRIESVIRDVLGSVADRLDFAFVFGSTARNQQTRESDIDLIVVGDVSLRILSEPLSTAERILGRRISPAMYTKDSFKQRYQSGDPFLQQVVRSEKMAVIRTGGEGDCGSLDDDIRAMVAERLDPAVRTND